MWIMGNTSEIQLASCYKYNLSISIIEINLIEPTLEPVLRQTGKQ